MYQSLFSAVISISSFSPQNNLIITDFTTEETELI